MVGFSSFFIYRAPPSPRLGELRLREAVLRRGKSGPNGIEVLRNEPNL